MLPTAVGLCLVLLVHVCGVEAATPLWPNCSVLSSYQLPGGGGDFEAVGCVFPATTTYVVVGVDAGATASVVIRDGSVLAGREARIGVDSSNMLGPVQVTITGMVFGRDASFLFTGNLSPLSSLLVANNTFNLTQLNDNSFQLPSGDSIIVAIRLGSIHQDMNVADGASIAVLNNSVTGSGLPSTCTIVAVCFLGQSGSIRNNSTLLLSGNSIVNSTVPSANVVLVYLYRSNPSGGGNTLTISNQSRMAITDNYMLKCTLSNTGYVAKLYLYSSVSSSTSNTTVSTITKVSLGGQSALAISGNSMAGCTASIYYGSIYVAYMYLYSYYYNTTTGSNTNIGMYLSTTVSVEGQSTFAMDGNSLLGSSANTAQAAYLHVLCQATTTSTWSNTYANVTLDLRGRSAVSLSGNTIGNCQAVTAEVVHFVYQCYADGSGTSGVGSRVLLLLGNQSTVAMSNNVIWGSTVTFLLYVARAYMSSNSYSGDVISGRGATTMTVSGQSVISISGNAMRNCTSTRMALVAKLQANAYGGSSSLTLDSQSRVLVDGNSLGTSLLSDGGQSISESSVAYVSIYCVTYDGLTILALSNGSAFSMSGNTAFKSNMTTVIYAAFLEIRSDGTSNGTIEISLSDQSRIDLSRNAIWGSTIREATVAYFSLSTRLRTQVTLGGQSAIAVNDNSLSNSSVRLNAVVAHFFTTPNIYTTFSGSNFITLSLSGQCEFTLSHNVLNNCSATNAYVAFLSSYSGLPSSHCDIALNESSVALSGNSLKGSAISNLAIVAQVSPYHLENMYYSSTDVALNNQSTLHLNGNSIGNCTVPVAYVALVGLNRDGGLSGLNVDGSSIVSVEGNRLAVGAAQATLSALLTIVANTSLSGGSRLVVVGNEVVGYGLLVNISHSVSVQATSALQVIGNRVDSSYSALADLADLSLSGSLVAEDNTISSAFDGYLLVNASRFVNGPSASVSACGNLRSWDGAALSAASHMNPSALGALAAACPNKPTPATTTTSTTERPTTSKVAPATTTTTRTTTERPTTSKVAPATTTTTRTTTERPSTTTELTTSVQFTTTSTVPAFFYVAVTSKRNVSAVTIGSGARHYNGSLMVCLPNGAGALACLLSFEMKPDAELYIRDVAAGRVSGAAAARPSTVAPEDDDDSNTGLIVGVVVGVVILAAIICVAVYMLSSRKSRSGGAAADNYSAMDAAFVHSDEAKVNLTSTEML